MRASNCASAGGSAESCSPLLRFSRRERSRLTEGARRPPVEDAPTPAGHSVELTVAEDVWVVVDPPRLDRVLVNLLTNAYRHGGRHILLEARPSPEGVLVVVSDDGAGVPDELAGSLFDKFSRDASDGRGAGLGLAIVRGLVEAFGGRVWYEPRKPTGARFCVLLNGAEANPKSPPARSLR